MLLGDTALNLFIITGAFVWFVLALVAILLIVRGLWDAFRALTITIWGCRICRKKTGSYFHQGMIRMFFTNWLNLLGTRHGSLSLQGPGGYWNEWNDWKVYQNYPIEQEDKGDE